jgi:hypothetical protein
MTEHMRYTPEESACQSGPPVHLSKLSAEFVEDERQACLLSGTRASTRFTEVFLSL